ncbi:MAG TPA: caspase family protein [Gemmatimonadaceae bacterium]|nr:caspase family protein [Gemmatimonadaceae bacterium]
MTPSPFANSIAVVIGIDHYADGIAELRSAVNDARRLGSILAAEHGYTVITLLDADASRERLTRLLTEELPQRVGADDRVLFYFAGHGVARDADDGPNGYLLPADARRGDESTYLHMPLVHDALLALECRHMLVVLDSCFSGAFRWSGTRAVVEEVEVVHQEKYDRFVKDPAWQVITSASQDQKALDQLSSGTLGSRDGDGAHSPFALAFFDAISGAGDLIPRGTGDGLVTATELYLYLEETLQAAVLAIGRQQTPRLWPLRKHDKGEYLFFVPGRALELPPAPTLTFENNPWLGLTSYDAGDSALFFGRDAEIAALCSRITSTPLTVVLGASGTGKSSLVKAGAIPALAKAGHHALPVMRPGRTPLGALAQALSTAGGAPVQASAEGIAAHLRTRLGDTTAATMLVLVIDQFEELITLAPAAERERMLTLLASLITEHADRLRVVLTIRTDFEPNFDRSAFGDRWLAGRYVVPPMSRENLRAVIEQPAAARVLYFEPSNLVETLLDEVVATPGALPLLSFALSEMYIGYVKRRSGDRAITRADYDALGGVVGALRSRAETEYAECDAASQGTMRRVMLRLVTTDGGGLARRRVTDDELAYANDAERARADDVVRRLTAARLLVEGREPDGEAFVEPAHDALVRGWGRLLQWVREESEARFPLAQQQRLGRAAEEWQRAEPGSKPALLWSDSSRSAQLAPLVRTRATWLNRRELAFATRSIRGRRITLATIVVTGLTIVAAATIAVVGGLRASARAEQVRIAALIRTATSMVREDPHVASLLLGSIDAEMVRRADDATRMAMLGAALELGRGARVIAAFESGGDITAADASTDGTRIAIAGADSIVRLWRSDGRGTPVLLRGAGSDVTMVRFSPGGDIVAAGTAGGTLHVWNADGLGMPRAWSAEAAPIVAMQFAPDGRRLLTTHEEGPALLWDLGGDAVPVEVGRPLETAVQVAWAGGGSRIVILLEDGRCELWPAAGSVRPLRRFVPDDVNTFAIAPDGARIALGSGLDGGRGMISVVRLASLAAPLTRRVQFLAHDVGVAAISWSPDGHRLVTTADDRQVREWDADRGALLSSHRQEESMQSADFSPDGTRLLMTSPHVFQPIVLQPGAPEQAITLAGQNTPLVNATFLAGSRRILTAASDGSARLWELPPPPFYHDPPIRPGEPAETGNVGTVAFTRDGRHVAIATTGGTVSLYWLDGASKVVILDSLMSGIRTLAFTADGAELRSLSVDGMRRSWSVASGRRTAEQPPIGQIAIRAEFARDARHVLTLDETRQVHVWDATSAAPPWRLMAAGETSAACREVSDNRCAALSHDGSAAAVIVRGDSVRLFRVGAAAAARTLAARPAPTALEFSHDGRTLAIGHQDGSTRLIGIAGADTGRHFAGHLKAVTQIGFSTDDRRLLTVSRYDNTIRVRDLPTGATASALRIRGQRLEDASFTADGRRLVTLGYGELEARLWNADGTGSPVPLSGDRAIVAGANASPDGRWLLTSTLSQTAQLHPIDVEQALRPLRVPGLCLSIPDRMRFLGEREADAATRHGACARTKHRDEPRARR